MAKAEAKTKVTSIILELSDKEAETLAAILGRVGGDPNGSPRKHTDSISTALGKAGFSWERRTDAYKCMNGEGIRFAKYSSLGV